MATILIVGAGMMGSALAVPIADRGHTVRIVGSPLDRDIISSLKSQRLHPKLRLELPSSIEPFFDDELERAAHDVDAIAFGVSSAGITWACGAVGPIIRPATPLFMITKGLVVEGGNVVTLPDAVKARLPASVASSIHPAAIAGPCIAGEIARKVPTCVVLAGRDRPSLERIAQWIETPYYRPLVTTDVVGAEVCAALKNAYAMGIAFPAGMHERGGGTAGSVAMHNLESAIMAQAVLEMRRLVRVLGGKPESASGLPGVGDLDVTTNGGRTGRFGRLLGLGLSRNEAIEKMEGATLECLEILAIVRDAFASRAIDDVLTNYPLLDHLAAVALDGAPVDVPMSRFFGPELTGDSA
ncbi:MAG: glycerol-3-phosphate dehydrogenase [Polyangiaceae bacterium]|nr:glycerol-3-phosphate dehydrogenase [Polyangiaceae bacterium]